MAFFRTILEWTDDSRNTIVHKLPLKKGGREINNRSKLIVRESQQAIFVHKGQVCDIFEAGMYDLQTQIFPILSKLAGWQYGFQTPITVDVYFVNTKQFTDCKWGTANPILMRDPEFGMVRVKGFGSYSFKVDNAKIFLQELFGTTSSYTTGDITNWLKTMLISTLTDVLGESKVSVLDLAGNTLEFNQIVRANVQEKFKSMGLKLVELLVENMSVPKEVEDAIDERSRLGILGDKTDVMMKISAADAMREAAKNPGMGGAFVGAGMGIGAGAGIGSIFAEAMKPSTPQQTENKGAVNSKSCPNCGSEVNAKAKFCPECGEKIPTKKFCPECGATISGKGKFCPECGTKL